MLGDTATLLILEASWLGAKRFEEMRSRTGLLKPLLSARLKRLAEADVLARVRYSDSPPRYEYRLTPKGRDTYWTALMMLRWERRWGPQHGKIRIRLRHVTCGEEFEPTPSCGACAGTFDARSVGWQEGPGIGWMKPTYSRRRLHRETAGNRDEGSILLDHVAQITGDRWAGLVLRSIFTGLRKFDEICADTAMATNVLSERLNWLCEIGMLRLQPYSDRPRRYEYRLTEKAIDYYPILVMLLQWGDRHYVAPEGPPLLLTHTPCGAILDPVVSCSSCGEAVHPAEVRFVLDESAGSETRLTAQRSA